MFWLMLLIVRLKVSPELRCTVVTEGAGFWPTQPASRHTSTAASVFCLIMELLTSTANLCRPVAVYETCDGHLLTSDRSQLPYFSLIPAPNFHPHVLLSLGHSRAAQQTQNVSACAIGHVHGRVEVRKLSNSLELEPARFGTTAKALNFRYTGAVIPFSAP